MPLTRRDLIHRTALAGAGLGLTASPATSLFASPEPKRILVLGGTGFIGPNTVRYAVARGHQVSIFTRGRSEANLPEGVERLVGDRNNDHTALEGRTWDAVLDNNCYDYRWAQKSTALLKDTTGHYLFVSSLSAYAVPEPSNRDPSVPITSSLPVETPTVQPPTGWKDGDEADYALMKAQSERIVETAFPGRCTIVRPTLIVGPGDRSGRWSYWPVRFQRGGEILAPGNPSHSTQIIDQRDLSEWHVRLIESGIRGTFNAAGPGEYLTMASMLEQVGSTVDTDWRLTWVTESFLETHGVQPWSDMPAWVPAWPIMYVDVAASVAAGLTYRSIPATARDTLSYETARPTDDDSHRPFSLTAARERAVLDAWAMEMSLPRHGENAGNP
jgi:2'-hydroxyisoflavone reductase